MSAEIELVRAYSTWCDRRAEARRASPYQSTMTAARRVSIRCFAAAVQRAIHGKSESAPASIRIGVQRAGGDIAIVLRIAAAGRLPE
jgi:hypothetical protein